MPPYQRLLGDAMHGIGDLFGRQDIVDAMARRGSSSGRGRSADHLRTGKLGTRGSQWPDRVGRPLAQSEGNGAAPMTTMLDLAFLFDVDNTLLDNDRVQADLAAHLTESYGVDACKL